MWQTFIEKNTARMGRVIVGTAIAATLGVTMVPAVEAQIGWTAQRDQVFELARADEESLVFGRQWQFPEAGNIAALTRSGPRSVYLLSLTPASDHQLFWADLENGTIDLLATLPLATVHDISLDSQGTLWLLTPGSLFRFNPATDSQPVMTTGLAEPIVGLAWFQDQLHVLIGPVGSQQSRLGILDPDTGSVSNSRDILGLDAPAGLVRIPLALDIDQAGHVAISLFSSSVIGDPPVIVPGVAEINESDSGLFATVSSLQGNNGWNNMPFALTAPAPIEVPALNHWTLAILSLLLILPALRLIGRQA